MTIACLNKNNINNSLGQTPTPINMMNGEVDDNHQFSDSENYADPVTDEELLGDLLRQRPTESDVKECVVIIDGAPVVDESKLPKLKGFLAKLFVKCGEIVSEFYPQDDDGKTKGYLFVEYKTREQAETAVATLNGHKLDKQHTFAVNLLSDIDKFQHILETWETPSTRSYKDHGNLFWWLLNPDCTDQFVVQYENGERVVVYANVSNNEPVALQEKLRWTETSCKWSPRGSYLGTFHHRGIALWGGERFEQIIKFAHDNVNFMDFSPCEHYVVTYMEPKSRYYDAADALRVWDVRTGEMRRAFPGGSQLVKDWPHFKWSYDDQYFASLKKDDAISVYVTPSCGLLDKKSIKIDGIQDFQWSPSENLMAYWIAEMDQKPARFVIMRLPDREELRSKNVFNVASARIFWQKNGDYCALKVDRYGKKKVEQDKSKGGVGEVQFVNMSYQIEIFNLRQRGIPNEVLEIKDGGNIKAFAWEPNGHKFALIAGDMRNQLMIYTMKDGLHHLQTFDKSTTVNQVFWSPAGQYLVAAGIKAASSGALLFIDSQELNIMNQQEHTGLTHIQWDPTGRYLASMVSCWADKPGDYGYMLWNFQGILRQRRPLERFAYLAWRPRPPSLLDEGKRKEIRKNLKNYIPKFEEKDRQSQSKASKEIVEKRLKLIGEFDQWREKQRRHFVKEKETRLKLRLGLDTDLVEGEDQERELNPEEMDEEVVEFLVREEEIVISTTAAAAAVNRE